MNLFGAVVAARNALYERGVLPQSRLTRPVVSVGNLSVGGSGKTPFVIYLAELLTARGLKVDILSRGYGRSSKGVRVVDPAGPASEFGDEPLLMRRRLNLPVVVGESRYEAGVEAERRFSCDLHLLDDGFQHRELARDFDIVLLAPDDLTDRLLPGGRLREPLGSLGRAHAVVWSGEEIPSGTPTNQSSLGTPTIAQLPPTTPVWRLQRRLEMPETHPQRPFAFCAIARPERFWNDLASAGVPIAGQRSFRDHHAYSRADLESLRREAERAGADGFVTTEKDAVKLEALAEPLSNLSVARLRLDLDKPSEAVEAILRRLNLAVR